MPHKIKGMKCMTHPVLSAVWQDHLEELVDSRLIDIFCKYSLKRMAVCIDAEVWEKCKGNEYSIRMELWKADHNY